MKYLDTKKNSLEEAVSQAMGGVVAKDLLEAGGKYLKYSDLLLQKGRLLAKGSNTAMIDKEISKEMKKLGIKESKDEYEKFFNSALKKFGVDSPADFKDDAKKKEFFNYVDKNYKAKAEETNLEEGRMKELHGYIAKGMSAQQIAKKMNVDVKTIETLMKEDTMNKNVDETLDAVRESNVAKQKSMREILADIWNMGEGKNVFELEEAPKMKNYKNEPNFFVNDKKDTLDKFRRRDGYGETEFASYLAQKTGKDPEDLYFDDDELVYGSKTIMRGAHKQTVDKLLAKLKTIRSQNEPDMGEGKTATGEKPTKVELDPKVK